MTTSKTRCQRHEEMGDGAVQSPAAGSTSASLRILTMSFFCSLVAGFILKFPPTKNWRGILATIENFWSGGGGVDWEMIRLR